MKKQFVLTTLAQFFAIVVMAQAFGEIHGKVTNPEGKPLPFTSVTAFNGSVTDGATTDEDGNYVIKPLAPGTYTIRCTVSELAEFELAEFSVYPDQISECNIPMQLPGTTLPDAVVEGIRDPLIHKDGGTHITMRYADLKNMASFKGGNLTAIVKSLSPDFKSEARGTNLYFRGSRAGSTLFFIDGMKIRENVPNVPASGVASVSVYTGGLPAKYGDCTGGVIVVETKNYLSEYYDKVNEQ